MRLVQDGRQGTWQRHVLIEHSRLLLLHRNFYTETMYGELIAAARPAWTNPW